MLFVYLDHKQCRLDLRGGNLPKALSSLAPWGWDGFLFFQLAMLDPARSAGEENALG